MKCSRPPFVSRRTCRQSVSDALCELVSRQVAGPDLPLGPDHDCRGHTFNGVVGSESVGRDELRPVEGASLCRGPGAFFAAAPGAAIRSCFARPAVPGACRPTRARASASASSEDFELELRLVLYPFYSLGVAAGGATRCETDIIIPKTPWMLPLPPCLSASILRPLTMAHRTQRKRVRQQPRATESHG